MRVYRHGVPDGVFAGGTIATIGMFDGVHLGHQRLLAAMAELHRACRLPRVVISFYPHPATVVRGTGSIPLLSALPEKCRALSGAGIDLLLLLHFTPAFAALSAAAFIERYLRQMLKVRHLVVGADTRVGASRQGDVAFLSAALSPYGAAVHVPEVLTDTDIKIGSRRVRELMTSGDVASAARLLGRPYAVRSRIVHGEGRGRSMGVPTANFAPVRQLLPSNGVYVTSLDVGDGPLPAVTNIGSRPTFAGVGVRCETHLLTPPGSALYGKRARLLFHARLRDERRFSSPQALQEQIAQDILGARTHFGQSA